MLRWLLALGGIATAIGLLGLQASSRSVQHYPVTLDGDLPAVVYEPRSEEPAPVVILAHGFAGDAAGMSALARSLVAAGYGVVVPELRGHGANPTPLPRGRPFGSRPALREDIEAALLYARTCGRFDPDRVALAGHSLGAAVALDYASMDPGVGAVIAISGARRWSGPYTPPNVLIIWASGDPFEIQEEGRRVGQKIAGLRQIVVDRLYGSVERGTAVKATEIPSSDHGRVPMSAETAARAIDWLERSIGPGVAANASSDTGRLQWSALAGVGLALLLLGLSGTRAPAGAVPELEPRDLWKDARALVELALALLLATLLAAGADRAQMSGPLGFLPLAGAREVVALLGIAGAILAATWNRRDGLPLLRGLSAGALADFALFFLPIYWIVGAGLEPFVSTWLAPHRVPYWVACSGLVLPFFITVEQRFRRSADWRTAPWHVVIRALFLGALLLGALRGYLSLAPLTLIVKLLLLLLAFEILALRITRHAPNPWLLALVQSAWLGWMLAATAPVDMPLA